MTRMGNPNDLPDWEQAPPGLGVTGKRRPGRESATLVSRGWDPIYAERSRLAPPASGADLWTIDEASLAAFTAALADSAKLLWEVTEAMEPFALRLDGHGP